jgi:hypothetical protein
LRTRREPAAGPWEPERDGDAASFVRRWTTRAALLAYCAPSGRTSRRSEAAGLCALFGEGLARVCPECLALGPHSACEWDPRTEPPAETTDRLLALRASFVAEHVVRFTASRALSARSVLRSALASSPPVAKEARGARSEAGVLLLRTWSLGLSLNNGREPLDQGLDAAAFEFGGARGGCLHLRERFDVDRFCSGHPQILGAPVVGGRALDFGPLPADAMADSLCLRTFTAHMARTHDPVLRAAHPLLVDFLAVNWCVLGCAAAFDRRSWTREITEVHVHPSCLLATEKSELLRHARFRWPNARIFWRAAANCPTAFALDMIFR